MEALYSILNEFGIPMKLVRLIKMCPNESYSRVRGGKQLSDMFPVVCGLKQRGAFLSLISTFLYSMPLGRFR